MRVVYFSIEWIEKEAHLKRRSGKDKDFELIAGSHYVTIDDNEITVCAYFAIHIKIEGQCDRIGPFLRGLGNYFLEQELK